MFQNLHSSSVQNGPKMEATQKSTKWDVGYSSLSSERTQIPTHATTWMNLENVAKREKPGISTQIVCESVDWKTPETGMHTGLGSCCEG